MTHGPDVWWVHYQNLPPNGDGCTYAAPEWLIEEPGTAPDHWTPPPPSEPPANPYAPPPHFTPRRRRHWWPRKRRNL